MTVGMSEEDFQTLPGGVTPEMLAYFRLVDPERTIPGEWRALYGRSMVVAS